MRTRRIMKIGRVLLMVLVAATVFGLIVMLLWNALVPGLFGGPVLSFWQAVGLLLLSRILFFGGPGGRFGGRHRGEWRHRFRERWEKMSPEERERVRQRWGGHCPWHEEDEADTSAVDAVE